MSEDFKIIIGPAKNFYLENPINLSKPRPKYLEKAKKLFYEYIKPLNFEKTKAIYKLSNEKTNKVLDMHLHHGQKLYYAIEMYSGLVFRQLSLAKYDQEWVNDHLVIIDALYGIIKPYDLIAPYRLDFKIKIGVDIKKYWATEINQELDGFNIINLASKEFSSIVTHEIEEISLEKHQQIKIARGKTLNKILINKKI